MVREYAIQLLAYGIMVSLPSGSHQKVHSLNSGSYQVHLLYSGSWFTLPPKVGHQVALQTRSVTSFISSTPLW